MNLASELPICLKSSLQGLVRKIYTSNAYECINSCSSLIKFDTKSHLIKDPKHEAKTRSYQKIGKGCIYFVTSSYVQKEIKMSEGSVNIDLPWHIPECTYQQRTWMEVLELLQWWHGRIWLLTIPPF